MDSDVFSLFGSQDDKIAFPHKEGLRLIGKSNRTRPICENEEKRALKTIFINRINFQFIKLPIISEHETVHLSGVIRNMDTLECPQHLIDQLDNYLENEELSQLLAEAEIAKTDILLTCSKKLLEINLKLREKDIASVEIMKPSEFVAKFLK